MSMTQPPEGQVAGDTPQASGATPTSDVTQTSGATQAGGVTQATGATQVRGEATDSFTPRWAKRRETKPSYMTTELWLTIAGVVALIITYNVADDTSLDLWRMCLLATILGAAYVVSRGLAKAASADEQHIPQHLRTEEVNRWTRS